MTKPGRPVEPDEIPFVDPETDLDPMPGIPVLADGVPGRVFVGGRVFASDKVVIRFDEPHPRFGEEFATKYYIPHPGGRLEWGHDGQVIELTHRG